MTRAKRFVEEALNLIGEAGVDASGDLTDDEKDATADPNVIDDTATGEDELDLGATPEPPEDEFGLGGTTLAPTVRIEKDGPITVSKGDVQLSIGDDGNIDITLDGTGAAEPDLGGLGDMTDKAEAPPEPSPEEDDYKIDWEKEKEEEPEGELKKESLEEGVSKARQILEMDKVITECEDKKYECMSCEGYDKCEDKYKKAEEEDESDFLTQGYM